MSGENWTFTKAETLGDKVYAEIKCRNAHTPESGERVTVTIPMRLFNAIRAGAFLEAAQVARRFMIGPPDDNDPMKIASAIQALIEKEPVND